MQKNILTVILLVVAFFVATKVQLFVKNNAPEPVVITQDKTNDYIASSTGTTDSGLFNTQDLEASSTKGDQI